MDYLLQVKIAALFGLLFLTLFFGFIPARVKWFRDTNGTGKFTLIKLKQLLVVSMIVDWAVIIYVVLQWRWGSKITLKSQWRCGVWRIIDMFHCDVALVRCRISKGTFVDRLHLSLFVYSLLRVRNEQAILKSLEFGVKFGLKVPPQTSERNTVCR